MIIHPFVDGNSRSQRVFVDELARETDWAIDWRTVNPAALAAARTVAYLDQGEVLTDVLRPAVVEPERLLVIVVTEEPRPTMSTVGEHWRTMLEHVDQHPDQQHTWATQHHPEHAAEQARQAQARQHLEQQQQRIQQAWTQQIRSGSDGLGHSGPRL
ncbi:hypothetical protein G4H71_21260 [Rhodococcus triatomae]|uniref:hypothetical protein n=1 Tax=Rhodococcus triatomae TaxID=300028 RepID=UPI001113CBD6|nr:hypothetical protein [Rhodococcus triatomae]QNG18851.1 hypothetical protein G4H72_09115 [Rhodococcus triatomae]QNG25236.1 hypothetical protein G4H71_21260 [Rhodococcus triatomae]